MTLAEIIRAFPDDFHRPYVPWYEGEAFMEREPIRLWDQIITGTVPNDSLRVMAVDLAAHYVKHPDLSVWRRFLWTDDIDRWGNRVYVGGVGEYGIGAFQIHRHLEPQAMWVWAA